MFSATWEEHLAHLTQVLEKITAAGLTIKTNKCQVGMTEIHYQGHVVGGDMVRPETRKVDTIMSWPIPQTKKQVTSFLGAVVSQVNSAGEEHPVLYLSQKLLPRCLCHHREGVLGNCMDFTKVVVLSLWL